MRNPKFRGTYQPYRDLSTFSAGDWRHRYVGLEGPSTLSEGTWTPRPREVATNLKKDLEILAYRHGIVERSGSEKPLVVGFLACHSQQLIDDFVGQGWIYLIHLLDESLWILWRLDKQVKRTQTRNLLYTQWPCHLTGCGKSVPPKTCRIDLAKLFTRTPLIHQPHADTTLS